MNRLAIVGGGSWGTALSIVLAPRFERVRLWAYEREVVQSVADKRQVYEHILHTYLLRCKSKRFAHMLAQGEEQLDDGHVHGATGS